MKTQYWVQTQCFECGYRRVHPMADARPMCIGCESKRISTRMIEEGVIAKLLQKKPPAAPSQK